MRTLLIHLVVCGLLLAGLAAVGCRSAPDVTTRDVLLGPLDRLSDALVVEVADPTRATLTAERIEAFQAEESNFLEREDRILGRLQVLHADYDAQSTEMEAEVEALTTLRRDFAEDIVRVVADLRATLEPGEWQAIVNRMAKEEKEWKSLLK